jgi:hypothetical protein
VYPHDLSAQGISGLHNTSAAALFFSFAVVVVVAGTLDVHFPTVSRQSVRV